MIADEYLVVISSASRVIQSTVHFFRISRLNAHREMESILTASLILTLSFLATSTEASLKHSLFQNIAVNDVIFNDDLLWESTARSKLDCACQCSRHGNCLTFTFLKGSQTDNCRGHSSNMTSLSPAASASGARSSVLTGSCPS